MCLGVMPVSVCVLCAWACSSLTCQQREADPLLLQLHRVVGQHMGAQELDEHGSSGRAAVPELLGHLFRCHHLKRGFT